MLEIMTVKQVAALLQVNEASIYKMIQEGLPTIAIGSHYRINKEDLEAYLRGDHPPAAKDEVVDTEPGEKVAETKEVTDRSIEDILRGG